MAQPKRSYGEKCLIGIAWRVLDRSGRRTVRKSLNSGMIGAARMVVLGGVDHYYRCNSARFEEVAGFYNRANIPTGEAGGRAGQFPQLGAPQ